MTAGVGMVTCGLGWRGGGRETTILGERVSMDRMPRLNFRILGTTEAPVPSLVQALCFLVLHQTEVQLRRLPGRGRCFPLSGAYEYLLQQP